MSLKPYKVARHKLFFVPLLVPKKVILWYSLMKPEKTWNKKQKVTVAVAWTLVFTKRARILFTFDLEGNSSRSGKIYHRLGGPRSQDLIHFPIERYSKI